MVSHASSEAKKSSYLFLNSSGGSLTAGLALYDVIVNYRASGLRFIAAVFGLAASIAVVLLTSGSPRIGCRHARLMLHQPEGSIEGSSSDILTATSEILRMNQELDMIYGQTMRMTSGVCSYEFYLSMSDAVSAGLIDHSLQHLHNFTKGPHTRICGVPPCTSMKTEGKRGTTSYLPRMPMY